MNETFGKRLKAIMANTNITQEELSKTAQFDRSNLSKFQNNKRSPNAEMIKKICNALNISADYLLGLSDSPTNDTTGKIVIEPKYYNMLNTYIYDERLKQTGLISDIVITILCHKYTMYYSAYFSNRYSNEKIFYEDFVKRNVKFVIPSDWGVEEREDEISRIKEFLGKDFSDDVIKEID